VLEFAPPAQVAKLVDAPDLGSGAERCGGSSPFLGTMIGLGLWVSVGFSPSVSHACPVVLGAVLQHVELPLFK
jgi:hypothetical protein